MVVAAGEQQAIGSGIELILHVVRLGVGADRVTRAEDSESSALCEIPPKVRS